MSGFLVDTNVLSEARKGPRCAEGVRRWFESVDESSLYLSVLTLGEIRLGILRIAERAPRQAEALGTWLRSIETTWAHRLLPVDAPVASRWASMTVSRSLPVIDALIGATALEHDLVLVTRNVTDLLGSEVLMINPFDEAGPAPG